MKSDDVTGVILAGGRSRRFGEAKARYVLDGRPMVEHVYHALRGITDHILLSVRDSDEGFSLPVSVVADRYPDAGPLAGVHAGLSAAETPWVVVVACDMPYLTEGVLRQVVDARGSNDAAIVARTPDGRIQPLCACYHVTILPIVHRAVASGRLSMHDLLDRLPRLEFVDVSGAALHNINTPADLTQ